MNFFNLSNNEKKNKEYLHVLNKLNDDLMEVDLIENGNILHLIDIEKIFSSESKILDILRHKSEENEKIKKFFNLKQEKPKQIVKNYNENLISHNNSKKKNKSNLNEILEIINDLQIYKEVVKYITKEIYNESHLFYELKSTFSDYFFQKYEKALKKFTEAENSSLKQEELKKTIDKVVFELQQFTRLLLEVVYLFYGIKNLLCETINPIFSLKNLTYFLIFHIFNASNYQIVLDFYKYENRTNELKLQENLNFFRGLSDLSLFCIPPKYSLDKNLIDRMTNSTLQEFRNTAKFDFLNKETFTERESEFFSAKDSVDKKIFLSVFSFGGRNLSHYDDLINNIDNNPKNISIISRELTNSEEQPFFDVNGEFPSETNNNHIDNAIKFKISMSSNSKDSREENKENIISEGKISEKYIGAIGNLESIKNVRSSLNKIKIIKKTIQKIYFGIHSFYIENHLSLPGELNHFEIISVFIYVIVNARIVDLLAECTFIENFTLSNIFESVGGYYFVVFRLIIQFFLDVDIKKINTKDKEVVLKDLCCIIIERLKNPDAYTKGLIINMKINVHKNYKMSI